MFEIPKNSDAGSPNLGNDGAEVWVTSNPSESGRMYSSTRDVIGQQNIQGACARTFLNVHVLLATLKSIEICLDGGVPIEQLFVLRR